MLRVEEGEFKWKSFVCRGNCLKSWRFRRLSTHGRGVEAGDRDESAAEEEAVEKKLEPRVKPRVIRLESS